MWGWGLGIWDLYSKIKGIKVFFCIDKTKIFKIDIIKTFIYLIYLE